MTDSMLAAEDAARAEPAPRRSRRLIDAPALVILALAAIVLVHAAWRVGPTYDEHFYVVSGMSYWANWDFALNREHPPLLKLLAGVLPTFIGPVALPEDHARLFNLPGAFFYQGAGEHWRTLLFLGRLPLCALTLLGGVVVYLATHRWFGVVPARVALVAFVANPSVIAHGSLAALDMGCATAMVAASVLWIAALRKPTSERRLAAGIAIGLACATKFTALLLWPVVFATALARVFATRTVAPLATLAWVVPVALSTFAACYGFEARSIDSVRRNQQFTGNRQVVDLGPAELTEAFAGHVGPERAAELEPLLQSMRRAQSTNGALERWLMRLRATAADASAPQERLDGLFGALALLDDAPGRLRKSAFKTVLEAPRPADGERADMLARLAGASVRTDAADPIAPWHEFWRLQQRADWDLVVLSHPALSRIVRAVFGEHRPVPLLSSLAGLDHQLAHARTGHASYYRGRSYRPEDFAAGVREPLYYLDVLLHKLPLGFVVLFVLGAVYALRPTPRWGRLDALVVLGTAALLLVLFSRSNALMGIRYVLPLLPLFALLAGRAAASQPRVASVLVVVGVLESIWIHPHHLMYFNVLAGGPSGGTYITVSGDDWGQDAALLGEWLEENRERVDEAGGLYYDPYIEADPIALGLGATLPLTRNARGLAAVNEANLRRDPQRYAWLADRPIVDTVGYTITIFDTRSTRPTPQRDGR